MGILYVLGVRLAHLCGRASNEFPAILSIGEAKKQRGGESLFCGLARKVDGVIVFGDPRELGMPGS